MIIEADRWMARHRLDNHGAARLQEPAHRCKQPCAISVGNAVKAMTVDNQVEEVLARQLENVVKREPRRKVLFRREAFGHADRRQREVDAEHVVAARSDVAAHRPRAAADLQSPRPSRRRSDHWERAIEKRAHVEIIELPPVPTGFLLGFEAAIGAFVRSLVLHTSEFRCGSAACLILLRPALVWCLEAGSQLLTRLPCRPAQPSSR